ncbi:uncharacterized protein H6S33_009387 [Morchella sextelata]|uniref:uncharacterized protein n=1 Tax=Morchella sextelata TaxID=1174677 RepID=UPI001D038387|nr:uncharacterized protein H6S33_009387 [Morchella sextelata]KAH0613007.1 hypothetical protein H6S33_009387 [Morchella sextelata]
MVDENDDPNIASARGVSTAAFLSTLVVNLVIFAVLTTIFTVLRRYNRRIYAPRTYISTIEPWRRLKTTDDDGDGFVDEVEHVKGFAGLLGWILSAWKIKDETVLRTNGLDGYFFLRYLKKAQTICFVGCCLTFPILLPLNGTGGGGQTGLDILSFSNINTKDAGIRNRLYAHVFVGYIFFGFVLFTVYRELVFYTTLRQAYMLSPQYATRISARTVLITTIPKKYLTETALKRVFDNVKRIWINTDTKELEDLVEERDKTILKLEAAEVKLIRLADAARRRGALGHDSPQEEGEVEGESGSIAARWLDRKDRPSHRLTPLFGEKVDTIDWCRGRLAELNPKIEELQAVQKNGDGKKMNSAFIEFTSQSAAQIALQTLAHNKPLHMAPRYIGVTPEEVIWTNLRLQWWERLVKGAAVTAAVSALVLFWSIPVAFVGLISNVTYLADTVPFLAWLTDLPKPVLGLITGLLPVVLLAVLMALLPIVLRILAKISGEPSVSFIELKVQNMYFAFQVIQVFLVTTLTSGASSAASSIYKNPMSATDLLASNLPKASNFYISFMILQGLAISSGALLQIAGLVLYKVLGMLLDGTPRKQWNRWSSLSGLGWGTVFPIYTNIAVIAITYSMIAPLVLGFAVVGLGLLHYAYRYNLLFVYNVNIDTKGLVYPRALYQTLTGVYLAQICLIGLFGVSESPGPAVLQVAFLIFTILFQLSLSSAMEPLLRFLPKNLEREEESLLSIENGDHIGVEEDVTPVASEADGDKIIHRPLGGVAPAESGGMITRFLHPETYENYAVMRKLIPRGFPEASYTANAEQEAYMNPAIVARPQAIWIPRDEGGVSRQEAAHTGSVVDISDEGAIVNEKSKVVWIEGEMPPGWHPGPVY